MFRFYVLSQTVSRGLEDQARCDIIGKITFVEIFDELFDCLNVSRLNQHLKAKSELRQYTDVDDRRFEVSFLFVPYSAKCTQQ